MSYPEIDPQTHRVINPEQWTPDEVRHAQQIASEQYGLANMTENDFRQAALYNSQHENFLGKQLQGMGFSGPKIDRMINMTPDKMYAKLKKLAGS